MQLMRLIEDNPVLRIWDFRRECWDKNRYITLDPYIQGLSTVWQFLDQDGEDYEITDEDIQAEDWSFQHFMKTEGLYE